LPNLGPPYRPFKLFHSRPPRGWPVGNSACVSYHWIRR